MPEIRPFHSDLQFESIDSVVGVSWKWVGEEVRGMYRESSIEDQVIFSDLLSKMSENARRLALFLIDYPDEFQVWIGMVSRRTDCKNQKCCNCALLRQFLFQKLGWSQRSIRLALRELRKKLRS